MDSPNPSAMGVVVVDEEGSHQGSHHSKWHLFGHGVPRSEIVFFSQIIILYIVICVSIYNLTLHKEDVNLWISLLSSSLGYMLPHPNIKK